MGVLVLGDVDNTFVEHTPADLLVNMEHQSSAEHLNDHLCTFLRYYLYSRLKELPVWFLEPAFCTSVDAIRTALCAEILRRRQQGPQVSLVPLFLGFSLFMDHSSQYPKQLCDKILSRKKATKVDKEKQSLLLDGLFVRSVFCVSLFSCFGRVSQYLYRQ